MANYALFEADIDGAHCCLLSHICTGMFENTKIIELWSNLFVENMFSSSTLEVAVKYYVKVFGDVRAKVPCRRYNSSIKKGSTVGIRQMHIGQRYLLIPFATKTYSLPPLHHH